MRFLVVFVFVFVFSISFVSGLSAFNSEDVEDHNITRYVDVPDNAENFTNFYVNFTDFSNVSYINISISNDSIKNISILDSYENYSLDSDLSGYVWDAFDGGSCSCGGCFMDDFDCMVPVYLSSDGNYTYNSNYDLKMPDGTVAGIPTQDKAPSEFYDIPPMKDFVDVVKKGGSVEDVLQTWNPPTYVALESSFSEFFAVDDMGSMGSVTVDFVKNLIKYIFREPASLVPNESYGI